MRWQATVCFYGQLGQAVISHERSRLFGQSRFYSGSRRFAATSSVDYNKDMDYKEQDVDSSGLVLIEQATLADIEAIQKCNRLSLPENYADSFYERHVNSWPGLTFVARRSQATKDVVGYVLGRLENETVGDNDLILKCGHITSLAVAESHRRRGVARGLMAAVHQSLARTYRVDRARLHVRSSNHSALRLYSSLGYTILAVVKDYYADGESAYLMCCANFDQRQTNNKKHFGFTLDSPLSGGGSGGGGKTGPRQV